MPTCLNIGCHQVYKPGYINIDESNEATSDRVLPPFELHLEDESVDLIESYNLLEQLTYEKGLISLEEWFRVLKPGAKLIIETINFDSLAENYCKAEDFLVKEPALKMIYESDNARFKHVSGYFLTKLHRMLTDIGFTDIKETTPKLRSYKEAFRLECSKSSDSTLKMVIIKTKKAALKDLDTLSILKPKTFWEFNNAIIDILLKPLVNRIETELPLNHEHFHKLISYSPKLAKFFIQECLNHQLITEKDSSSLIYIFDQLIKHNFILASYKAFLDISKETEPAINYYIEILEQNTLFISRLFQLPADAIIKTISDYTGTIFGDNETITCELSNDLFSYEIINEQSFFLELLASKSFAHNDLTTAEQLYKLALNLNPELTLAYINYGLLEIKNKKYENTIELLTKALEVVQSDNENDVLLLNLGICHLYLQQYEEAIKYGLNIKEDSAEKFLLLGNCYYLIQNYSEAYEAFSWASILNNLAITYVNLSLTYDKLNNKELSKTNYQKALEIDPAIKVPTLPYLPSFKNKPYSLEEL